MKRTVILMWIILLLGFASKAMAQAVIEPKVNIAQYEVSGMNSLTGQDGKIAYVKNAGTFSGLAMHFYGNARPTTIKALAAANGRVFNRANPKSLWIFQGETIKIPEPLIKSLTISGSNPTKMSIEESTQKSVTVLRNVVKYLGVNLPNQADKIAGDIVTGLQNSDTEYNLNGQLVHTVTFDHEVQDFTRIKTDVIGPSTLVSLEGNLLLRAVHAKECNNLNIQILLPPEPPKEEIPPPKSPLPQAKMFLMKHVPEPANGRVVGVYIHLLEEKRGVHMEAITEYRYSRPWDNSIASKDEGFGNQVSIYTNNQGDWWWGPAGMSDQWWGTVENNYRYDGHYVAPGVSIKYEEKYWNVKSHLFIGTFFEDGRDKQGYGTEKDFHDVLTGDVSVSSKNIARLIPVFEEVNFVIWGRIDPSHVHYRSTWQGKPITEKVIGKNIIGLRTDWDFQSWDINKNGMTITPGIGYEYDKNEWDWGHGPFMTWTLGHRMLDKDNGEYIYTYPPHKYLKLYFGLDLERQSYKFKATLFWAEAYYAYKDAKLKSLLDQLGSKRRSKEVDNSIPVNLTAEERIFFDEGRDLTESEKQAIEPEPKETVPVKLTPEQTIFSGEENGLIEEPKAIEPEPKETVPVKLTPEQTIFSGEESGLIEEVKAIVPEKEIRGEIPAEDISETVQGPGNQEAEIVVEDL